MIWMIKVVIMYFPLFNIQINYKAIVSEQSWTNSFFLSRYSSSKFLLDSFFISTSYLILVPHFFCVIHQNVLPFTMKFYVFYTLCTQNIGITWEWLLYMYVCIHTYLIIYYIFHDYRALEVTISRESLK